MYVVCKVAEDAMYDICLRYTTVLQVVCTWLSQVVAIEKAQIPAQYCYYRICIGGVHNYKHPCAIPIHRIPCDSRRQDWGRVYFVLNTSHHYVVHMKDQ